MNPDFVPGQRWMSDPEPELGLGLVAEVNRRQVVLLFPASEEERRYNRQAAPLRRVRFRKGEEVHTRDGESFVIQDVQELDGLLHYIGETQECLESSLQDTLATDGPEERLRLGHWDSPSSYRLRRDLWEFQNDWLRSPARGLMGGRIDLLPHQLYIAQEVLKHPHPRVLLADEPGLGKTIEASLILHHSLHVGRANRVLLLVPESLQHQWFVELLRRFHLVFRIVNDEHCHSLEEHNPEANPFEEDSLILCSTSWLLQDPRRMGQLLNVDWDLMIVDEAHHIESGSSAYELLSMLSQQVPGVLLLTATPEQLGAESHFARLQLLDPDRYSEYATFQRQGELYQHLADTAAKLLSMETPFSLTSEEIRYWQEQGELHLLEALQEACGATEEVRLETVSELLDRFGPGRVMFRNTRAAIQGFPQRNVELIPLETSSTHDSLPSSSILEQDSPRLQWLLGWLEQNSDKKALLLCKTREMVQALESHLRYNTSAEVALFHEGMTLLQRDRNAAWFAEPDGARLLLCSEIGGEGRNFQMAQHLILFDLPEDPELLEQRIGRLDRIGQADQIFLHVPYEKQTEQEVWARWYHEGLDAFQRSRPGGYLVLEEFVDSLYAVAEQSPWSTSSLKSLLQKTSTFQEELQSRLSKGRNRLLEWSSFSRDKVETLLEELEDFEDDDELHELTSRLFDHFGVEMEPLEDESWILKPTHRLHPTFPWLKGDKRRIAFSREKALERDTTLFLSPDHPMFSESVSMFLSSQTGNCSVVGMEGMSPEIRVVATYLLESVSPPSLRTERFLPPTPVVFALNHEHKELGLLELLRQEDEWESLPPAQLEEQPQLVERVIPRLLKTARSKAEDKAETLRIRALRSAESHYRPEIERLQYLANINPQVSEEDVRELEEECTRVLEYLGKARLRLDSLQVQLVGL